jgi:RND superfamily putative drug exporter
VAIAYLISIRLAAFVGQQVGISMPTEVQPVIVVLLFGVITDYSIFFLARHRRLLRDGQPRVAAADRTDRELRPIVLAAGPIVALGSASLVVARVGFLQAFGPGIAMAVLVALAVAASRRPASTASRPAYWRRPSCSSNATRSRTIGGRSRGCRTGWPPSRASPASSAHASNQPDGRSARCWPATATPHATSSCPRTTRSGVVAYGR